MPALHFFGFGLGIDSPIESLFFIIFLLAFYGVAIIGIPCWLFMIFDLIVGDRGFTKQEKRFWIVASVISLPFFVFLPIIGIMYVQTIRSNKKDASSLDANQDPHDQGS